jgi:hypothetical protein
LIENGTALASEQSAHHAADQATRAATTAVMASTTGTMGRMGVNGIVATAGVGLRFGDDFGQ